MHFLRRIHQYLRTALIPNRFFLKTRSTDVSLYFFGLFWMSIWTTIIDSFLLQQSIPFLVWFILHFIFTAVTIVLYLLFVSYLNRWFVQWILPKPWAFRQVFPYTVAANVWTFPTGVLIYQLGYPSVGMTVLLAGHLIYSLTPLFFARRNKKKSSQRSY